MLCKQHIPFVLTALLAPTNALFTALTIILRRTSSTPIALA